MNIKPHYLGTPITNADELKTAMRDRGLDFQVEKAEHINPRTGNKTGYYDIFRTDTNAMIGSGLSSRYNPIQHTDSHGLIVDLAKHHGGPAYLTDARVFDGGAIVTASVDMGLVAIGDAKIGDVVARRITIADNHDGSGKRRIVYTPFRLRCYNGQCSAGAVEGFAIRHTAQADSRMKEISRLLLNLDQDMAKTDATFQAMAAKPVSRDQFARVLEILFPSKGTEGEDKKRNGAIKEQIAHNFMVADGGFIDRDTAWNAFNAITHWTNHSAPVRVHGIEKPTEAHKSQARAASILMGNAGLVNARAMQTIVKEFALDDDISALLAKVETSQVAQLALYEAPARNEVIDILSMGVGTGSY